MADDESRAFLSMKKDVKEKNAASGSVALPPKKSRLMHDLMSGNYREFVEKFAVECRKIAQEVIYMGAEHPADRRKKLALQFNSDDLCIYYAVINFRGFSFDNYMKKGDESAVKIRNMVGSLKIKTRDRTGRVTGTNSPLAIVSSFPELNMAICLQFADSDYPLQWMFKGEKFDKIKFLSIKYLFLGSICCLYHKDEEKPETRVNAIVEMVREYDAFQNFYVDSRRKAAKLQNPSKKSASDEEVQAAKLRSRSYYLLSLQTYSIETRRGWHRGEYGIEVTKGGDLKGDVDLVKGLADAFGMTPEQIATPMPAVRK